MSVFLLHSDDEPALEELLLEDPTQNLFLLGMLSTGVGRASWYAVAEGDRLRAVAMVLGRLCVPFAPRPKDATGLGSHLATRHTPDLVVGPREAVDALLAYWTPKKPGVRYDQRLYVLDRPPAQAPDLAVKRAEPGHADRIAPLAAAMEREDLGRGPANPDVHHAVVRDRIAEGRTWIAEEGGEIVFLINVGTRHPFGCQVGGTYVPPPHRGRGLGTRGMVAVAHRLLAEHPRVTLHVNEANTPAVRAYERAGFRSGAPYRLILMETA